MRLQLLLAILLVLAALPAADATTVVINSADWMDVYSGTEYAALTGASSRFMTGKQYVAILNQVIPRTEHVTVIESQKVPFSINLAGNMGRTGYSTETIYASGGRGTNIELAKLANVTHYIVVDPSYGYNAIAVIPYALKSRAYVLFADGKNIDQVLAFLKTRPVDSLILYGQLDEGLVAKLSVLNPEVINKGNRYKDNVEIVKKYLSIAPAAQLLLTDGSFIEDELMRAGLLNEVTLLIGKDTVTDETIKFVRSENFKTGMIIGNHLSSSGKRLKDATGLPLFIKFGQGITRGTESEPVRALDMFQLPVVDLNLILLRAQYNALTKNIEITYENNGTRAFLRTSAGVLANGERVITVGDTDVRRVESGDTAGFEYDADLTQYITEQKSLTLDLFTLYGESPDTMDHAIALTAPLQVVTVKDDCQLTLKDVQYNTRTQRFMVSVRNDGPVPCYSSLEMRGVIIDDKPTNVAQPGIARIEKGGTEVVEIKQRMTDVDLADNSQVLVHVNYGARSDFLLSTLESRMPLKQYTGSAINSTIVLISIIAVLIIVIIVLIILYKRKRLPWK